jgi:ABC-type transport system involved in multi-copper enzyme maturation permease subunit
MIGTFAMFDVVNFATPLKRILPPILMVLIAVVASPWPAVGIGGAAIIMSLLAPNPFAADERGRLDTLYATLPVSRRTVVFGRYVALLVLYVAVAAFATLIAIVIPLIEGESVDFALLGLVNAGSFFVFGLAIAVQLPFFFSIGFTHARPMMYIPVAVLAGGAWLAAQTGILDTVDLGTVVSVNPAVLWVTGLVLVLAALAGSAVISSERYRRRAL